MYVQTFVSEPPVKRFNKRVLNGLPWTGEVGLHADAIGLVFEGERLKLRAVFVGENSLGT